MSYSFQVRGADKVSVKAAVATALSEIASRPEHIAQAEAVASAMVDMLADDAGKDIVVTINGSLLGGEALRSASLSVGAGHADRG